MSMAAVELARLMTENEKLRQRVAELEEVLLDYEEGVKSKEWASIVKDAERYRWLKKEGSDKLVLIAYGQKAACEFGLHEVDAAIDAAIEKGEPL